MIVEGIHINGLYSHYKGGTYKVLEVANYHDNELPKVVVYYKCDINGLFKSIRIYNGDDETIIKQPFYRFIEDFQKKINIDDPQNINRQDTRFKFIKQL